MLSIPTFSGERDLAEYLRRVEAVLRELQSKAVQGVEWPLSLAAGTLSSRSGGLSNTGLFVWLTAATEENGDGYGDLENPTTWWTYNFATVQPAGGVWAADGFLAGELSNTYEVPNQHCYAEGGIQIGARMGIGPSLHDFGYPDVGEPDPGYRFYPMAVVNGGSTATRLVVPLLVGSDGSYWICEPNGVNGVCVTTE